MEERKSRVKGERRGVWRKERKKGVMQVRGGEEYPGEHPYLPSSIP